MNNTIIAIVLSIGLTALSMSYGALIGYRYGSAEMYDFIDEHWDYCLDEWEYCLDKWETCEQKECICDNPEPEILYLSSEPEFMSIVMESAIYDYDVDRRNCEWFATTAMRNLDKAGYDASKVLVTVNCTSGYFDLESCLRYEGRHAIVRIDNVFIESVSGEIIEPSEYEIYGIDWRVLS